MITWRMTRCVLIVGAAACSSPGEPEADPRAGVAAIVGEWCDPAKGEVTEVRRSDPFVFVDLYRNMSRIRAVAGTDGIFREQEVRSCEFKPCAFNNDITPMSDAQAIAACAAS